MDKGCWLITLVISFIVAAGVCLNDYMDQAKCDIKPVPASKIYIKGQVKDIREECVFLMGALYKQRMKFSSEDAAKGYLIDILLQAIDKKDMVEREITEQEKMAYTE